MCGTPTPQNPMKEIANCENAKYPLIYSYLCPTCKRKEKPVDITVKIVFGILFP